MLNLLFDYVYFSRIYRNTVNFSILQKFNLYSFYFLPKIKNVQVNIFLNNIFYLSDLRVFKAYYFIFYLTGFKPFINGFATRYSSNNKFYNINISFFLFNRFCYNLIVKISRNFFFKLKEFFFYENSFKFFSNSFIFSISNINLWKEFESNPIFFK